MQNIPNDFSYKLLTKEKNISKYNYLFKKLINLKNKENHFLKIWDSETPTRKNKKIYFKKKKYNEIFNKKEIILLKYLEKKIKDYAKLKNSKIGNLERIQIIKSKFKNNKKKTLVDDYVHKFHIDRINTFKIMFYIKNIKEIDGPINIASIDDIYEHNKLKKKILIIEKLKKKINFRKIKSEYKPKKFNIMSAKKNSLLLLDGRIPHRAGILKKNGLRKVIIFEYFSKFDSHLYKKEFNNY